MDISTYKRDKARVMGALKVMDDRSVIALEPLRIHIPNRYLDRGLAAIGDRVSTLAVYALLTNDGHYMVSLAPCRVYLRPNAIREIKIDGEGYFEFEFAKGDTVIESTTVVQEEIITYYMYSEFDAKGKMPWFMDEDLNPRLFDNAKHFCGGYIGDNPQVYRVLHSIRNRDPENVRRPWRQAIRTEDDVKRIKPVIVALSAINITSSGTLPRLLGSYLSDTIRSAIIDPSERAEGGEIIMRK